MNNRIIISVQFDNDPQPPNVMVPPKPKFIATVKVISSYQIGQDGKVKRIA